MRLLEQAIARDPRYGIALGAAAFCHSQIAVSGWSDDFERERRQGTERARQALECARDDPNAVIWATGALTNFGEDIDVMKGLIDGALVRNPNSAVGWFWSGWIRVFAGGADLAIEHFETSLRLDPLATRRAFHLTGIGIGHFFRRRFGQAASLLLASLHELPSYIVTQWFLASCYAHMGRLDEARELIARFNIPAVPNIEKLLYDPEQRELFLSGLRLAAGNTP